jgi:hypothetical protein
LRVFLYKTIITFPVARDSPFHDKKTAKGSREEDFKGVPPLLSFKTLNAAAAA